MTKQELIDRLKDINREPLDITSAHPTGSFTFVPSGNAQFSTTNSLHISNSIPIEEYLKFVMFQSQFETSFNELSKLLEKYPKYPGLAKWDISKYPELFAIFMGQISNLSLDDFKFMAHLPLNIIEMFVQKNKNNIKNINLSHLEIEDLEYLHLKYFS